MVIQLKISINFFLIASLVYHSVIVETGKKIGDVRGMGQDYFHLCSTILVAFQCYWNRAKCESVSFVCPYFTVKTDQVSA